jgi:membrane protein implicated in regulation of membrane protease activity
MKPETQALLFFTILGAAALAVAIAIVLGAIRGSPFQVVLLLVGAVINGWVIYRGYRNVHPRK